MHIPNNWKSRNFCIVLYPGNHSLPLLVPSNHSITQSISYEENSSNSAYIDLHREGKLHSRTASCKVSQILQMTTNIDNMAIFCVLSLPTVVMYSLTRINPLSAATNHYGCQIHRQLKCAQTRRKVFHSNQEWHHFHTKGDPGLCISFRSNLC